MTTETPSPITEPVTEPADTDTAGASREAAGYRRQLRAVEAERDTLTGQLTATRRALAEQALTAGVDIDGRKMRPTVIGDLFDLAGLDIASLYGDDGTFNTDALTEAARGLHATRPALFETIAQRGLIGPYVPPEGDAPTGTLGTPTWADAFKPERA